MVVCGAEIYTVGSRVATQKVIRDLDFYIDETPYMRDMSFFAKISKTSAMISMSKGLVGVDANCASTGKPPPSNVKDGVSLRPGKPNKRY